MRAEAKVKKIVLTGGPCGGKTSAIERVRAHFSACGWRVLIVSEVATDLIGGGLSPALCRTGKDYQEAQVGLQIAKELAYERAAASMPCDRVLIVCDRGVMDNRAYMSGEEFADIVGGLGYSIDNLLHGYDAVFHLETAALADGYTTENNAARSESPEAAIALDRAVRAAWQAHPAFHVIENKPTFAEKAACLIAAIEACLGEEPAPAPDKRERVVLAIGRWMPIHKGHKKFLVGLARTFDKLVVGIGSCYENGTARNCIPAVEREILLRKIFRHEGIPDEKLVILPVPDRDTFEGWINDVIAICEKHHVTHFCTGNKEDILDVLAEKNISLDLEMIDPEADSDIAYHATDVRNAILRGDEDAMREMLPAEVLELVREQVTREIAAVAARQGRGFVPGKQTVDIVLLCREADGDYILMGKRSSYKRDFAGYAALPGSGILEHESAIDAAMRVLRLETGVDCHVSDRTTLPMTAVLKNGLEKPASLYFVNLFSSEDMAVNGTMGGASQCFLLVAEGVRAALEGCLYSRHDLEALHFVPVGALADIDPAYEQKSMIYEALDMVGIACPEERFDELREDGSRTGKTVTRREAHRRGILHGAVHTCIIRRGEGGTEILMQKRSDTKDSFPSQYDLSSAGHVEAGCDFAETACRELLEELGLSVEADALRELLRYRLESIDTFHGALFHNEELCRVYVLERDVDPSVLTLQTEEVSEVRWFAVSEVLAGLRAGDARFCTNTDEFEKIAALL